MFVQPHLSITVLHIEVAKCPQEKEMGKLDSSLRPMQIVTLCKYFLLWLPEFSFVKGGTYDFRVFFQPGYVIVHDKTWNRCNI